MSHVPPSLRQAVIRRAGNRCEYCGLAQAGQEATFHMDHVVPVVRNGKTALENLALACVSCSLRKGSGATAVDPLTRSTVRLFNPRKDSWRQHFKWKVNLLVGITPKGRATVARLNLNRPAIINIRGEEALDGRHPPPMK